MTRSTRPASTGSAGLADLLPPSSAWLGNAADVAALSASGTCPLTGPVWGEGDILLGGAGSDTITGRAGDDDHRRRQVPAGRDQRPHQPGRPDHRDRRTDLMEHQATSGNFGPSTTGMTLQQAVFAGIVDPGNLVAVREIVSPAAGTDTGSIDTAVFSGPQSSYTITAGTKPGQVIVNQTGAVGGTAEGQRRHRHPDQHRAAAVHRRNRRVDGLRAPRPGSARSPATARRR